MENHHKNAAVEISEMFVTREHIDSGSMFWKDNFLSFT